MITNTTPAAPPQQPWNQYPKGDEDRAAYAAGLRHLAALIESGQAPIPFGPLDLFLCYGATPTEEQPKIARDLLRALGGGHWEKKPNNSTLDLTGMCGGVPLRIYLDRDAVCERVVVGVKTVEIPAEPAREARTEQRELVEWRCGPLLADANV